MIEIDHPQHTHSICPTARIEMKYYFNLKHMNFTWPSCPLSLDRYIIPKCSFRFVCSNSSISLPLFLSFCFSLSFHNSCILSLIKTTTTRSFDCSWTIDYEHYYPHNYSVFRCCLHITKCWWTIFYKNIKINTSNGTSNFFQRIGKWKIFFSTKFLNSYPSQRLSTCVIKKSNFWWPQTQKIVKHRRKNRR